MRHLSPEQRLVAGCIAHTLGQGPCLEAWRDAALDWPRLASLAFGYGLAPLVHVGLRLSGLAAPSSVAARLRAGYLGAAARIELEVAPTLRRALEALQASGIEPIVLKGAALAYTAYGDPAHRTLSDIDLLVPTAQIREAGDVLVGAGFRKKAGGTEASHHLRPYLLPEGSIGVELHDRLLPEPNPYRLDVADLLARTRSTTIAGHPARVLAPSDSLLLACVHLAFTHRYQWFPMRALTDIAAIGARDDQELDWDLFLETVERSRTAGAAFWPLLMSRLWLRAGIPPAMLHKLRPAPAVAWLVKAFTTPSYVLDGQAPSATGSRVLYRALAEFSLHTGCPPRDQIAAVAAILFPPPDRIGHLPPDFTRSRMRYAAYLTRPGRLVHGLCAFVRLARGPPGR